MNLNRVAVIDIETTGLLGDMLDYSSFPYKLKSEAKLWCVVIRNVGTNEVFHAVKEEITAEWIEQTLAPFTHIVAHNGIKFDFIALKLFGVLDYRVGYLDEEDLLFGRAVKYVDTAIISRLLNPDRYLGHSLDSWGERVGNAKTDFRQACIDAEILDPKAPRGAEFSQYSEIMLDYCIQDTSTNADVFKALLKEMGGYAGWKQATKMEHKLADLAIRRENLGFYFDKDLAIRCLEDLTQKMEAIENSINPILPPKKMNKGELSGFTPPKTQLRKDGTPARAIQNFAIRLGAEIVKTGTNHVLRYEDKDYPLPWYEPLKTHTAATVKDLDHVKMFLMKQGWVPSEWRERDLTRDAKKQLLPYDKRIAALDRWIEETKAGKYKKARLEIMEMPADLLREVLANRLAMDRPVRVPTSPSVRVGVEKELCPNLVKLGDKVSFAGDFALYLTLKHRKSSIAGGDIEDMDFDQEYPNTGYLANYREVDHRIPTPAIEIGASTNRYKHIGVANIPRASSVYGKEMRSLFGSGPKALQFGYDFSSLEARIMGHYVMKYPEGEELAASMLAEKPNDIHSRNAAKLGIQRSEAKSLTYGILYGAQPPKIAKMLGVDLNRAQEIYNDFWNAVPALKKLKENVEKFWEEHDKKFVPGVDGRKILIRSQHSILNALFQSAGVISAKYVNVLTMQILENAGYQIDPFVGDPDVCEMIAYHDEVQLYIKKKIVTFETFQSEEEAKAFVKAYEGPGQLSAISEGKTWYVTLPNDVSMAIEEAIKKAEEILKLNVNLGYEWIVNTTWYGCH